MPKQTTLILLSLFMSTIVFSQNISNKQIGLSMGLQGKSCEYIPNTTNLDFLNYLDTDNFTGNYLYLAFTGNFKIKQQSYLNLVVGMYSDLLPVKYNISFSHIPWNIFGFGISLLGYPEYINEITQFHWDNDQSMFGSLDTNYWQKKNYNLGLALGPEIKYEHNGLTIDLRLHAGLRWINNFETRIAQKEINGNYRRVFDYAIKRNFTPYVLPEFELRYRLFSISDSKIGVKLRAACEFANRTQNYNRTTYEWTAANRITTGVNLAKHKYSTTEFDFGFFYEW